MLMKTTATTELINDYTAAPSAPLRRWLRVLGAWIERSRQRHALADLDDRLLKDAGISRFDAVHEIAKPFWR